MTNLLLLYLFACFYCVASQIVCPAGSELGANDACIPCAPGSARDDASGLTFCSLCESGSFQSLPGQTSCVPCPQGTVSSFAATMCGACLDGQFVSSNGTCGECPPGEELSQFSPSCSSCIAGSFKAGDGPGPCLTCPPGTVSTFGASMCGACLDGQTVFQNGTCGECPPGQELSQFDRSCFSCSNGFFKADEGPGPCLPCPPGEFSMFGGTACIKCPENEAPVMPDGSCGQCAPGSFFSEISFSCLECDSGSFTNVPNVFSDCFSCEGNTFSLPGATECFTCPENQAQIAADGSCGQCPPGTFLSSFGDFCTPCPIGTFTNVSNVFSQCVSCEGNSFASTGATQCFSCPENQSFILAEGGCGQCPPGSFYQEFALDCSECFSGTFTNVPNVLRSCLSCGGNSFASSGATECIPCPIGQVFINSTLSCEPECEPGFIYNEFELECQQCSVNQFSSGGDQRFCNSCSSGSFARVGSSTCFLCPSGQSFIEIIDGCGVCPENAPYNSFDATCGFDSSVIITPLPEPGQE